MSAIHLEWNPVGQQLESLRALVEELRREVGESRAENAELRREVGYWQSMHARAIERNTKSQSELELEEAKAEIRQLKAERFGKKTEKQSASDRTNWLDDPFDVIPVEEAALFIQRNWRNSSRATEWMFVTSMLSTSHGQLAE